MTLKTKLKTFFNEDYNFENCPKCGTEDKCHSSWGEKYYCKKCKLHFGRDTSRGLK
jgi:hypothetical protein